jgi:hypothetical protein
MVTAYALDTDRITHTRLRFGHADDLPAVGRLIHRANAADRAPHIDATELEAVAHRGQLLVLQRSETELAAAACVAPGRGLVFLVIDPELASPELEHRMIGVADALCESDPGTSCGTRPSRGRL